MLKHVAMLMVAAGGAALVAATFLPLLRSPLWWVRVLDFPRIQIAVLLAAAITFWIIVWTPNRWWSVAALVLFVVALAYQLIRIAPYTPLAGIELADATGSAERDQPTIRLLVANVLMENRHYDRLIDVVERENPDIVLLLETDRAWGEQVQVLTHARPHRISQPRDNTYGMELLSRFPLHDVTIRELTVEDVPSIRADIELDAGQRVTLYAVHPPPALAG